MTFISIAENLARLGIASTNNGSSTGQDFFASGIDITSYSPADASQIASVKTSAHHDYDHVLAKAQEAFIEFRQISGILIIQNMY